MRSSGRTGARNAGLCFLWPRVRGGQPIDERQRHVATSTERLFAEKIAVLTVGVKSTLGFVRSLDPRDLCPYCRSDLTTARKFT
jgi:hypothetical protein